jgi:hypothetical protein
MQNVLAHESGDSGVQLNKKTEGRKFRETVPLIYLWLAQMSASWLVLHVVLVIVVEPELQGAALLSLLGLEPLQNVYKDFQIVHNTVYAIRKG